MGIKLKNHCEGGKMFLIGSNLTLNIIWRKKMDIWLGWLKQAKRFVKMAKLCLNNNYQEGSYYLSLHAGELVLKSVLIHCGIFEESDKTHNMLDLLQKIENHNCLSSRVLNDIKNIVESPESPSNGLSHVDIAYQPYASPNINVRIDCEASMTSAIRYPQNSIPPYEYIDNSKARKKVMLADKLILLLEQTLNI